MHRPAGWTLDRETAAYEPRAPPPLHRAAQAKLVSPEKNPEKPRSPTSPRTPKPLPKRLCPCARDAPTSGSTVAGVPDHCRLRASNPTDPLVPALPPYSKLTRGRVGSRGTRWAPLRPSVEGDAGGRTGRRGPRSRTPSSQGRRVRKRCVALPASSPRFRASPAELTQPVVGRRHVGLARKGLLNKHAVDLWVGVGEHGELVIEIGGLAERR